MQTGNGEGEAGPSAEVDIKIISKEAIRNGRRIKLGVSARATDAETAANSTEGWLVEALVLAKATEIEVNLEETKYYDVKNEGGELAAHDALANFVVHAKRWTYRQDAGLARALGLTRALGTTTDNPYLRYPKNHADRDSIEFVSLRHGTKPSLYLASANGNDVLGVMRSRKLWDANEWKDSPDFLKRGLRAMTQWVETACKGTRWKCCTQEYDVGLASYLATDETKRVAAVLEGSAPMMTNDDAHALMVRLRGEPS